MYYEEKIKVLNKNVTRNLKYICIQNFGVCYLYLVYYLACSVLVYGSYNVINIYVFMYTRKK